MALTGAVSLLPIEAATYQPHALHGDDRSWPETNCYVDLWIEVLHAFGFDPMAGLAFTLSADFDGEQWEFFKFPLDDLRLLYGIEVNEINVWRPITEHIVEHLRLGHLLTVEVDSWYLPDTAGVAYRMAHQKTTIAPQMIDLGARRLGYFHNRSYYELGGDDFDHVLRLAGDRLELAPYVERIRFDRAPERTPGEVRAITDELVVSHLARRPDSNPVRRLGERIERDIEWLRGSDPETFHGYAFGTLRQCGSWAELVSSFARWLGVPDAGDAFGMLSDSAKACQFKVARAVSGRQVDIGGLFAEMAQHWQAGYASLLGRHG